MNTLNKRRFDRLALMISLLSAGFAVSNSYALPQQVDVDAGLNPADGSYAVGVDGATGNTLGTLTVFQDNRVVNVGGDGINIASNEILNVTHSGGNSNWSVLLRDANTNGNSSLIDGVLRGDIRVVLVNANGIVFGAGAQIDLKSLIATTHNIDAFDYADFNSIMNGDITLNSQGNNAKIVVNGLKTSLNGGSQIALIADRIDVNGNIELSEAELSLIVGSQVVVSNPANNLLQFEVTQALQTSANDQLINISANGSINAANVALRAWATDPRSFAINNDGVVRAAGIDTATPGVIRLVGHGAKIRSFGELNTDSANGIGDITAQAGDVELGGTITAADVSIAVGDNNDASEMLFGNLTVKAGTDVSIDSLTVTGVGVINTIRGLANYDITGLNSGTAGYMGVGQNSWDNIGAITFSNVGRLFATSEVENTINVAVGGKLEQSLNGITTGSVTGGALSDTFTISGELEFANGAGNPDSFIMNGGVVHQRIDGGADIDTLENVFNPSFTNGGGQPLPLGSGSSDFVANWASIEMIVESQLPPIPGDPQGPGAPTLPIVDPTEPTNANNVPQVPVLAIVDPSAVSLGIVGDANLNLPCGYHSPSELNTADELSAEAEEDCFGKSAGEYQALMSSIIHFDHDSAMITSVSANRLDRIANFVKESQIIDSIVLSGHTNDLGSKAYNEKLSNRRVLAASDYISAKEVDENLIKSHFYGESLPAKPNENEENRAFNRRVHIDLER